MLTTVLMCQQGIPFRNSPARTQMIEELIQRGSEIVVFFPGHVDSIEIKQKVKKIINTKKMKKKAIKKKLLEINPDIIICFTIEDIEICFYLPYLMKNTDFYYYNLEIYVRSLKIRNKRYCNFSNKIDYLQNKFKEMLYINGCEALVVQDKLRKKILKKYWISHQNTWLIPNSYYTNHNKYNVSHKGGLIYSGSVGSDVLGSFIEQISEFDNVKITICGWNRINAKIKKNSNINLIVHNPSQEKYTEFISAYDIALIWYSDRNDNDDNVYNIGFASGKFFKHLSLGQPVIVNNAPGLAKEVKKYQLGIVINDLKELNMAVQTITSNYEFYVRNIQRIYDVKYDYKKVSKGFYDFIINKALISKTH